MQRDLGLDEAWQRHLWSIWAEDVYIHGIGRAVVDDQFEV